MARKKAHEKEPNHERWLVSYGDFITLLFAVFVTLYAMSQTDKAKVEEVVQSMRESFGYSHSTTPSRKVNILDSTDLRSIPSVKPEIPPPGPPRGQGEGGKKSHADEQEFRQIKSSIDAYLSRQGAQEKVSLAITGRGLIISLKEAGFFDSGSATVKESSYPLLNKIAESIGHYNNPIRIEGHTDTIPIRTAAFPSNWELSTTRATNVVHYLVGNFGFPPDKMAAAGYGEFRPVADNGSEDGRRKNRRVDIVMLSRESERDEP
jgi:chemotaxis protein MotB